MNPILKNILAVAAGIILGGMVNMGIIMISGSIIPPPEGVIPMDIESIKANMHLFESKHFIAPFLAHALGTMVGAFTCVKIAANRHLKLALLIGIFFLFGGIQVAIQLPAPLWFKALDLVVAYIPMAMLGWNLGMQKQN